MTPAGGEEYWLAPVAGPGHPQHNVTIWVSTFLGPLPVGSQQSMLIHQSQPTTQPHIV